VEFIWVCKDTTSFEWFQVLLSSLEAQSQEAANRPSSNQTEFLKIHTYLTQNVDADTAQNIVLNSVGAAVDPLTELKSRLNFGRPDFARLLKCMADSITDGTYISGREGTVRTNVGVYFCGIFLLSTTAFHPLSLSLHIPPIVTDRVTPGPNSAARDIRKACNTATTPVVNFSFWKEHF
jgi:NADPH oxidase